MSEEQGGENVQPQATDQRGQETSSWDLSGHVEDGKLLGKFDTPDALVKSYQALESKMGSKQDGQGSMRIDAAPTEPAQLIDSIETLLTRAGVSADDIGKSWSENSSLSDEQYAAFQKVGLGKGVIDEFVRGQQNSVELGQIRLQQAETAAAESVGGRDKLETMIEWAKANLSEGDRGAYHKLVEVQTADSMTAAARYLETKYMESVGKTGNEPPVQGHAGSGEVVGFTDRNDPQYLEALADVEQNGINASPESLNRLRATDAGSFKKRK